MVNGYRTKSSDSTKRMMVGLFYFISTNTSSGVKANAYSLVNALLKKTYEAGGTPTTLWVSPSVKAALSTIDANLRRSDRSDTTAGATVERILTDYGDVTVKMNRHRSEEHTSELQSLMRISYAVFCLKKKKKRKTKNTEK